MRNSQKILFKDNAMQLMTWKIGKWQKNTIIKYVWSIIFKRSVDVHIEALEALVECGLNPGVPEPQISSPTH